MVVIGALTTSLMNDLHVIIWSSCFCCWQS